MTGQGRYSRSYTADCCISLRVVGVYQGLEPTFCIFCTNCVFALSKVKLILSIQEDLDLFAYQHLALSRRQTAKDCNYNKG
jgi:hypothetical protein